jgi:hypothetical protein
MDHLVNSFGFFGKSVESTLLIQSNMLHMDHALYSSNYKRTKLRNKTKKENFKSLGLLFYFDKFL